MRKLFIAVAITLLLTASPALAQTTQGLDRALDTIAGDGKLCRCRFSF